MHIFILASTVPFRENNGHVAFSFHFRMSHQCNHIKLALQSVTNTKTLDATLLPLCRRAFCLWLPWRTPGPVRSGRWSESSEYLKFDLRKRSIFFPIFAHLYTLDLCQLAANYIGVQRQEYGVSKTTLMVTKDTDVDRCSQVINVGDEEKLFALVNELLEQPRVVETLVCISVTWRVPTENK